MVFQHVFFGCMHVCNLVLSQSGKVIVATWPQELKNLGLVPLAAAVLQIPIDQTLLSNSSHT